MQVLVSGSVIGHNKEDLLQIGQAAEALGIVLKDRQIGYRRKNISQGAQKETSGRKNSPVKSFDSLPVLKTEPTEEMENQSDIIGFGNEGGIEKEKPGKHACTTCGKVFGKADKLKRHMNVHKSEKEKPFKCDECGKTVSSSSGLKTHKLLHSGELLKCEFCEYTNVQKGNLKTLRMKVNKEELNDVNARGIESDTDVNLPITENLNNKQVDSEENTEGAKNENMEIIATIGNKEITDNTDMENANSVGADVRLGSPDVIKEGAENEDLEQSKYSGSGVE